MLTLILQTQEGHKIELNVRPEDTFADLKSQYADHEVLGLSDSLEQLITNGSNVPESTKIFDYVTASAQDWFSTDTVEEPVPSRSTETGTKFKECCAQGCTNTEITTPGKPFFPLPTDRNSLSACLIEVGRPDLYNRIFGFYPEECQKYFLCDSHVSQESSILPVRTAVEQPASLSLLKPKNDRPRLNVIEGTILTKENEEKEEEDHHEQDEEKGEDEDEDEVKEKEEKDDEKEEDKKEEVNDNEFQGVNFDSKDSMLELFDTAENFHHPGILCRLCGKVAPNPIHLYAVRAENIEEEFSLADKINLCLPVAISITDPLPKQICQDCHVKLNVCHDLALSSLQTEDKLKVMLREKKLCFNVNAEKQCPLCVEGNMSIVKKSGIYRTEDARDDGELATKVETIVLPEDNSTNLSSPDKLRLDNFTRVSSTNDNVLEAISLPLTDDEFSCSIYSTKIVDNEAHETHDCRPEDCNLSRSCVICGDSSFTDSQELRAHYEGHGAGNDETIDQSNRCVSQNIEETKNKVRKRGNNNSKIHCDNNDVILPSEETSKKDDFTRVTCDMTTIAENFILKPSFDDGETKISGKKLKIRYSCNFCEKQFARKSSLEKHITSFHDNSSRDHGVSECYKCKVCSEAFALETDAKNHATMKHPLSPVDDDVNSLDYNFFIEQLVVTRLYVCEYCEHSFTIPSSLHEHRNNEHSKNIKYTCAMCKVTFDYHRQLAYHKTLCSHQRRPLDVLGIKQFYVCKYCDKLFLNHSTHTSHSQQHRTSGRPYLCRICNKNFVNYHDITKHRDELHPYQTILHEGSSLTYNCQYCCKKFSQEVALFKHIRMHTGERPYKCMICAKAFSQSSGLYTHLKIHSDLRPYSCTKCPRTFKIKSDRDNHIKKHAGHRPYKCEFCDKAFMTQHVYSQHCKIHTDDRPYKCDICDQAFRRSHVLTVHMRRHTGEKPYVCEMCPKTYRQRGDLLKHRKLQHGIKNITENSGRILESNNRRDDEFDNFDKSSIHVDIRDSFDSILLPL